MSEHSAETVRTERAPSFRPLSGEEARELLARNHVGRIAFARAGKVDVVPVHYVFADGWLYGRTAPETRIATAGARWSPVAFEVDEVEGLFDWRSVIVRGGLYTLNPDSTGWEAEAWETGLRHFRTLVPAAFSDGDPTPQRSTLFRIAVQEVTGQQSSTRE